MDTSQFVAEEFARELLCSSEAGYKQMLATGDPDGDSVSPLFAGAMRAFQKLSAEDQDAMARFFTAVITDSASTVFGIIDGSTSSENLNGEFQLSYEGSLVSGDLQGYFLAAVEDQLGA